MRVASHRVCTAPMMDWSDRHCRYFFRQLSSLAPVYTEMITSGALLHGDAERHLRFHPMEHPVALQLGGSEPFDLARCAALARQWGYDEINLNCGCPSERVQRGAFGACLMAEPTLVADCVRAMQDASGLPVTVKHRLGLDYAEDYDFVRRFVEVLANSGCGTYVVHARNAVLKGLSPKDNREVPSLRYDEVYRLKREFPEVQIIVNGGIRTWSEIEMHLQYVDGIMLGRAAYHDPYILSEADSRLFGSGTNPKTRAEVVTAMHAYARVETARGVSLRSIARHMLGLFHGQSRARLWRGMLSDSTRLAANDPDLLMQALDAATSTAHPAIAA